MYERKLNRRGIAFPANLPLKGRSSVPWLVPLYFLALGVLFLANWKLAVTHKLFLGIAAFPILIYLLAQRFFSLVHHPLKLPRSAHPKGRCRVAVVLTMYNEEPELAKQAVKSLANQDAEIDEIYVIDDGSQDPSAYQTVVHMLKKWENASLRVSSDSVIVSDDPLHRPRWIFHRFQTNRGKRRAQSWAFQKTDADLIVTVDSDSVLEPDAIRRLLQPFKYRDVMAVAGQVEVANGKDNLLTRLTSLHFDYIFNTECAAHSATGHLLYTSGPLAAYRREVIQEHLDDYLHQTWWGRLVQMGDDRFLTRKANGMGRTVYQSSARCHTRVADTWRRFLSQQLRWARSLFIESFLSLRDYALHKKAFPFLWSLGECLLAPLLVLSLVLDIAFRGEAMGWTLLLFYGGYLLVFTLLRNLSPLHNQPLAALGFLPLLGLLQFGVITLIRTWALLTLHTSSWSR